MKRIVALSIVALLLASASAFAKSGAQTSNTNPNLAPKPPAPKTDLQRAIENPIKPNPPPTALQKLERGQIPSQANKSPDGKWSITSTPGVREDKPGTFPTIQYKKTY
jgi:hypothetical protein